LGPVYMRILQKAWHDSHQKSWISS
jgi:hypothetical protein